MFNSVPDGLPCTTINTHLCWLPLLCYTSVSDLQCVPSLALLRVSSSQLAGTTLAVLLMVAIDNFQQPTIQHLPRPILCRTVQLPKQLCSAGSRAGPACRDNVSLRLPLLKCSCHTYCVAMLLPLTNILKQWILPHDQPLPCRQQGWITLQEQCLPCPCWTSPSVTTPCLLIGTCLVGEMETSIICFLCLCLERLMQDRDPCSLLTTTRLTEWILNCRLQLVIRSSAPTC